MGRRRARARRYGSPLRLVDVASGIQLWSGRFEDSGEDVFALQDRIGRRMAEALRTELLIAAYRDQVPPEAMALYRQGLTQALSMPRIMPDELITPLERCIEQFPDFLPALALHAVATMRAWFMRTADATRDWGAVARASLERALRQAPELAETLMARGMMATQERRLAHGRRLLASGAGCGADLRERLAVPGQPPVRGGARG